MIKILLVLDLRENGVTSIISYHLKICKKLLKKIVVSLMVIFHIDGRVSEDT